MFRASAMTYTIKDDLSVTQALNGMPGITLLSQCGVKDISAIQEKTVKIGKEEALAILVGSLKSKTS
ncbi:hypothetical protein QYE76_049808 [Lolium multiflorum]|uniref:Uncharacterized protein n=1 Tax=Lolium multiflorum TaxID=4521 RepID=A0AAD8SQ05_LOLMU|nr:hypothetical protein QYE76_049808 [Lolium multiflorum]